MQCTHNLIIYVGVSRSYPTFFSWAPDIPYYNKVKREDHNLLFCKSNLVWDQILQVKFGPGPNFASQFWSGTKCCKSISVQYMDQKFAGRTKFCKSNLVQDQILLAKFGPGTNFCKDQIWSGDQFLQGPNLVRGPIFARTKFAMTVQIR